MANENFISFDKFIETVWETSGVRGGSYAESAKLHNCQRFFKKKEKVNNLNKMTISYTKKMKQKHSAIVYNVTKKKTGTVLVEFAF